MSTQQFEHDGFNSPREVEVARAKPPTTPSAEALAAERIDLPLVLKALDRLVEAHVHRTNPFHDPIASDAQMALRELRTFLATSGQAASAVPHWPERIKSEDSDDVPAKAFNGGYNSAISSCEFAGLEAFAAKLRDTDIEKAIDSLIQRAWVWAQSCEVDGVAFNEKGDSHNEWLRDETQAAKRKVLAMLSASPTQPASAQAAPAQPRDRQE